MIVQIQGIRFAFSQKQNSISCDSTGWKCLAVVIIEAVRVCTDDVIPNQTTPSVVQEMQQTLSNDCKDRSRERNFL